MKIYDISQELLTSAVYPGDTAPSLRAVRRTERGDLYNLSELEICVHNGTHVDAPFHFIGGGKTVDGIPLCKTVGPCKVAEFEGRLSADDARALLASASPQAQKRILIKGDATVTREAAVVFAEAGIYLIGVESQSVGEPSAPMEVHLILLEKETVLLEGIRLGGVATGEYLLSAAPINIGGCDGAPCRAVLIEL